MSEDNVIYVPFRCSYCGKSGITAPDYAPPPRCSCNNQPMAVDGPLISDEKKEAVWQEMVDGWLPDLLAEGFLWADGFGGMHDFCDANMIGEEVHAQLGCTGMNELQDWIHQRLLAIASGVVPPPTLESSDSTPRHGADETDLPNDGFDTINRLAALWGRVAVDCFGWPPVSADEIHLHVDMAPFQQEWVAEYNRRWDRVLDLSTPTPEKTLAKAQRLAHYALPLSDDEWGSDRQVEAENTFFNFILPRFSEDQRIDLESYCMKATTEEMLAEGLTQLRKALGLGRDHLITTRADRPDINAHCEVCGKRAYHHDLIHAPFDLEAHGDIHYCVIH